MTVKFSDKAPGGATQLIQTHLSNGQNNSTSGGARTFSQQDEANLVTSNGLQVWSMNLEDSKSMSIDNALEGSWKYMIIESSNVISEVQLDTSAGAARVLSSGFGPATVGIMDALLLAEENLGDSNDDYEPRVLQIPSLTVVSLWMHSTTATDIFYLVPPSSLQEFENFVPIEQEAFLSALQDEVVTLQSNSEQNPGPSGGSGGLQGMTWPPQMKNQGVLPTKMDFKSLNFAIPAAGSASGGFNANQLPHFMEFQLESNWCWSAVGTSVGNLLGTGSWTQCDTATGCLPGRNCCSSPRPCNIYGYLDRSLTYTKSFSSYTSSMATLSEIQNEIDQGKPICTRVAWSGGGAHFMAITGYNGREITIQDPAYGTTTMRFDDYAAGYQTGGYWSHTYYTQP